MLFCYPDLGNGFNLVVPSLHLSSGETDVQKEEMIWLWPYRLLMTDWDSNLCLQLLSGLSSVAHSV